MPENNTLISLVNSLAGVRVLVAGDAMLDHYVVGLVERISPEAPVPVLLVNREFDRVGGAANVAANVASLGGVAELICLVGRDRSDGREPEAERLRKKCVELGIETTLLRFLPCTIRKTRMLAGRQQMLRVDWEPPFGHTETELKQARAEGAPGRPLPLPESAREARREALKPLLKSCDVVLVSDYAKGLIDGSLMEQLRASGLPVIVDPRPQNAHLYSGVRLITPNRKEAAEILGLDALQPHPGPELGRAISDKLGCDALVTLGSEGMCLVTQDGPLESIATQAREVFDVTGAGDTVAAVTALGVGAGLTLSQAAQLANAAAGIVVSHIGTATVSPEELRAALAGA